MSDSHTDTVFYATFVLQMVVNSPKMAHSQSMPNFRKKRYVQKKKNTP